MSLLTEWISSIFSFKRDFMWGSFGDRFSRRGELTEALHILYNVSFKHAYKSFFYSPFSVP